MNVAVRDLSSRNRTSGDIRLKRAYDAPAAEDGIRVLVDRLWPRGVKKESAVIDYWFKELSPTTKLRKWFGHDPARWEEFQRRFLIELRDHPEEIDQLRNLARQRRITLVYGARDRLHNDAVVLRNLLLNL
jgi:uncharacterized protein YeaO (DUF488 family)